MPNRKYNKGANFERAVKKGLEGFGLFVVRSAGSKGPADLIAIDESGDVTLIQCEVNATTKRKRDALKKYAIAYNCHALMVKKGRKEDEWVTIHGKTDT